MPYAHYSNEELINLVYRSGSATQLELEFAFRLENNYADDVKVTEDPYESNVKDVNFGENTRRRG